MNASDNFAEAMKELLNNGGSSNTAQPQEANPADPNFPPFSPYQTNTPSPISQQPYAASNLQQEIDVQETPLDMSRSEADLRETSAMPFDNSFQPAADQFSIPNNDADMIPNDYAAMPTTPPPLGTAGAENVTVISSTTTIIGDLSVDGCLLVEGNVKGNIFVSDAFESHGKIIGNIEANDITLQSTAIKGNVIARNAIQIDEQTTVVGDVSAPSGEFRGKIKGNLSVDGLGHFSSNAILVGNLVSGTVIIDQGAMLKGDIEITSAQDEEVTVDELDFDLSLDQN